MKKSSLLATIVAGALVASAAHAQVRVDQPWVRTTVPQQTTTGAYMTITSKQGGTLIAASSPVATSVEVHEMTMDGDTMKMRPVDALPLPAGKPVELKAGAYHMMLIGLKKAVRSGDTVPIRLVVEDASGKRETVDVQATAKLSM